MAPPSAGEGKYWFTLTFPLGIKKSRLYSSHIKYNNIKSHKIVSVAACHHRYQFPPVTWQGKIIQETETAIILYRILLTNMIYILYLSTQSCLPPIIWLMTVWHLYHSDSMTQWLMIWLTVSSDETSNQITGLCYIYLKMFNGEKR